jgi:DNA-nicking Smr family endonuclease
VQRRPPRGLSAEERALWQKVTETAVPMHPDHPRKVTKDAKQPRPSHQPGEAPPRFRIGQKAAQTAPAHPAAPDPAHAPVRMDRKSFDRMKRGKLSPEARIDLHGMTVAQAHPALTSFILRAHADGKRLVLVITGKGKRAEDDGPIPVRRGVLKHQVPHWLTSPPLGSAVLQITPAHAKHGGTGAYYVYLKRQR